MFWKRNVLPAAMWHLILLSLIMNSHGQSDPSNECLANNSSNGESSKCESIEEECTEHSETELQTCLLNWCNGPARRKSKCLLTQRLPSKKYTFINQKKNWTEAQHYCQQNHTGLAIINTTEDMTAALKVVEKEGQNMGPVWICLHREKREQYGHKCTVSEKLKWEHIDCNKETRYMCQRVCSLPNNTILKIYTIHDDSKTQKDAEKDCCKKGGHLASILNEEEKKKFDEIDFKPNKDVLVWIGLKWSEEAKLWKWSSGDTFQNWTNELPPNSDKNCMVLEEKEKNLWNEDKCREEIPFLCYDDLPSANPTSAPISASKSTSPSTTTATATSASGDSTTSQKTATTMETTPHDLTMTSTSSSPSASAPTQILTTIPQKTSAVSTSSQTTAPVTDYLHYINESKIWIDALVHCEEAHSHLVHITNETLWAGVKKLVSNTTFPSKGVWVGLKRNIVNCDGLWRWSKGPNVNDTTSHWSPDFPLNPHIHFCGKLAKDEDVDEISWLDESCFQELPFICQD